jgi:cell division septation protein DedD
MSTVVDPETGEQGVVDDEVAPESAAPDTLTCPNCGAPADPGQLMCLECGSRLALDYARPPGWRLPAAIVGIVLLLAGVGVAIGLSSVAGDANKTAAAPATQAPPQNAPADAAPTTAQPAATTPTASTPTPAPAASSTTTPAPASTTPAPAATPTPAPATASGWPPGKSAFTVILASLPSKSAADAKLKAAQAGGITTAAILHSDAFPTLRPGYWVVFDGQYDTIGQAQSQAATDSGKGGFTDAYPRFVSKDANAKP